MPSAAIWYFELDGEDIMRIIMKKESNQEGDCGIRACQLASIIIIIIRSLPIIRFYSPFPPILRFVLFSE